MMRWTLLALALAACSSQPAAENKAAPVEVKPAPSPKPSPSSAALLPASGGYKCIDGSRMRVQFTADKAVVTRSGKTLVLRRGANGAYAAGSVSFEGAGGIMNFSQPGLPPLPCSPIRR